MWHCWIVWDRLFQKPGLQEEELQLERRLFFTGITRAKHQLEFFTSKRCDVTRLEISPFIYELHAPKEEEAKVAGERPVAQPKSCERVACVAVCGLHMPRLEKAAL